MDGENLLETYDLENIFDARAERSQRELALVGLDGLKIFDERGQPGRIDVIHSGEIE